MELCCEFDSYIVGLLPDQLTELIFGNNFRQPIGNLPSQLKKLKFGDAFDRPINNEISKLLNLKELEFGANFNKPIDNLLPDNIEILILGSRFNQSVNNLPSSLIRLKFGFDFNKNFTSKFLPNLQFLKFGYWFNQSLTNKLNYSNLLHLTLGNKFNKYINGVIPDSLVKLTVDINYSHPLIINETSLSNLKILCFDSTYSNNNNKRNDQITNPKIKIITKRKLNRQIYYYN